MPLLVLGVAVSLGCASDPETELTIPTQSDDGGGASDEAAAPDASDGSEEDREVATERDADGSPPVTVAVVATPSSILDGGSEQEANAEALIMALAAGSGGIVIEQAWTDATDPSGTPIASEWEDLSAKLGFIRQQHRATLVSIPTVDGTLDRRPDDLRSTPWSGVAMRDAVHALLDATMAVAGDEVEYLSLGMEVDRYLATYPAQASAYVAFLLEAVQYAREHASRPAALRVGVTWSAATWLPDGEPTALQQQLRDGTDVLMLSFWAFDSAGHALDPEIAAATVGSVVDNVQAGEVVLHQVAYASSPLLASSEVRQAEFVRALFAAVGAGVPFVGVASLHDPEPKACVSFAEARGAPDSTEMFAFWCSTGLRQRSGSPKDAFAAYLEAASGQEKR